MISPAPDLLAIVREYLETEILSDSNLSDDKRFNVRVAVNLLATAERELRLGPAARAAEDARLTSLIGPDGSIDEKNQRLARAIREGIVTGDNPQLLDHLRHTIIDALRVNNPKWLDG